MTPPSRTDIEAAITVPTFVVEWKQGGTWYGITDYVLNVEGDMSTTTNEDNPMGFGDTSSHECTITLSLDLQGAEWGQIPIRVFMGFNGNTVRYFQGIISERTRDVYTMQFNCKSFAELVKDSKGYSPAIFRRPAASRTTVSSVEDPANAGWRGGLINFILWTSGGRPVDQDFSYPNAKFYYSCDQAIFPLEWQWVAGENLWDEALKLARAAGGQLYQGVDGVVYYKNPLSFAEGAQTYIYTEDSFTDIKEAASTSQQVGTIICNFTPRYVRPVQEVYKLEKPTLIEPGKIHVFKCETQFPLSKFIFDPNVVDVPDKAEQVYATFFDGTKAPVASSGGYLTSVAFESAQKIELNVANTGTQSLVVHRITLYGEPIVAGDQSSESFGTGDPQKQLEDNVYIQTPEHARRICMLVKDFYGSIRPTRSLSGCAFDTDRFVGEVVGLTYAPWSLTNAPHRVSNIKYSDTGTSMDVDLIPITGLPVNGDFYIVGGSYTTSPLTIKQLSY